MPNSPIFPCELFNIVGQHLLGDCAYGTCASLNSTSHSIYDATLQTLWTHMYWTGYGDASKLKREEVEEKWKVIKASPGARYIKYMIEPALFDSTSDDGDAAEEDEFICQDETPFISSSLSKTLKASIMLIHRGSSPQIQVHLYDQYGYSLLEMAGVWRTLDFAISLPGFESVSHVKICVHASPSAGALLPGGVLEGIPDDDDKEEEEQETMSGGAVGDLGILPTPPVDGWLQGITLHIDTSVKFEVDDYVVLSIYIFIMLRPYAETRMYEDDKTMDCPKLRMTAAQPDILLGLTAAYTRLCDSDPLYATFDIAFELGYNEEIGWVELDREDIFGIITLLAFTRLNFNKASRKIPLKMLGSFYAWQERELFAALIRVDVERKELLSRFSYGYQTPINDVDKLEDAIVAGSGEEEGEN